MDESTTSTARRVLYAVAPFLFPRTYGSLLYVWFSFPLGLAYFIGLTVGLLVGGALTLLWIGLALLFVTFVAAWWAEGLERQLANLLLGAQVPARRDVSTPEAARRGWFGTIFFGPALWKGLLFLGLKFPLGLVGWIASVVSLAVSLAFLSVPFLYLFGENAVRVSWDATSWPLSTIDSFAGTLPFGFAGLVGLVVTLHLHNALGWLWARLAELLLGARIPGPEVTESSDDPSTALPALAG